MHGIGISGSLGIELDQSSLGGNREWSPSADPLALTFIHSDRAALQTRVVLPHRCFAGLRQTRVGGPV